jgi:dolichyl-phosphate beta-glucosyltransferase
MDGIGLPEQSRLRITWRQISMSGPLPPVAAKLTSLILPAFNPGASGAITWQRLRSFLKSAPGNWEVLIVCDGCNDGTDERLRDWTRSHAEQVRVLSYAPNRGKGYAVRLGLAAARGQWRIFTDFDLAYDFDEIVRLARLLQDGADVAVASRWHADSQIQLPARLQGYAFLRYLQSQLFSGLVRLLLPIDLRDTQAGLKGFSAAASQHLVPRLTCDGFEFDCELLTGCARLGIPVVEMPVLVRYDTRASTTSWRTSLGMIRGLWRIRKHWKTIPPLPDSPPEHEWRRAA